jgi:hypothetical protein
MPAFLAFARPALAAGALAFGILALGLAAAPPAAAQLNNKPFSFNTPDGGVGMSRAARQAIILDQVFDVRPDDLLRDPQGNLGTVEEGPGGTVVFRTSGGTILPRFRGTTWRGIGDFAGSWNAFFIPGSGSGYPYRHASSAADTIGGWTSQLDPRGGGFVRVSGSPLDTWVSMVGMLDR